MKQQILPLSIALSAILCSSCLREINMDEYRTSPKVVLNSVVSPDINIMAGVSHTVFFTNLPEDVNIEDAEVDLYINGSMAEKMQWTSIKDSTIEESPAVGIYTSTIVPKTGDVVKIVAATQYGTAWAEDIIPQKVEIEDLVFSYKFEDYDPEISSGSSRYETVLKYEITFQDLANEPNYYFIRIGDGSSRYSPEHNLVGLDYSYDQVFLDQVPITNGNGGDNSITGNGGRAFSDKLFDGKKYTMTIIERNAFEEYEVEDAILRRIYLYSLSESYYKYLLSTVNRTTDSPDIEMPEYGLAEPKDTYSNIHNGVGILGACQLSEVMDSVNVEVENKKKNYTAHFLKAELD